jgi:hypothetical protein
MIRKMSLFVAPAVALLILASTVTATPRHVRLKHPSLPKGQQLPAEVS